MLCEAALVLWVKPAAPATRHFARQKTSLDIAELAIIPNDVSVAMTA